VNPAFEGMDELVVTNRLPWMSSSYWPQLLWNERLERRFFLHERNEWYVSWPTFYMVPQYETLFI